MKFSFFKLIIIFTAAFQLLINYSSFAQIGNFIVPNGHSSTIEQVKLDNQGKYLYSLENQKILMWDAKTSEQLYSFMLNANSVEEFTLSHDGKKLAVVADNKIICFSTVTGKELFQNKSQSFSNATFSLDDRKIFTVYEGIVEIDADNGKYQNLIKAPIDTYKVRIDLLDKNRILIHNRRGWQIWDINLKKLQSKVELDKEVFGHVYLETYGYMGVHYNDSDLTFLKLSDGSIVKKFPVKGIALLPSLDSKELILYDNSSDEEFVTLYNANLIPVKVIKSAKSVEISVKLTTLFRFKLTTYSAGN